MNRAAYHLCMQSGRIEGREVVWAYLVVSDPGQSHTLPDQEEWARARAFDLGWNLTKVYRDVDSGRDGTRALFDGLLADIKALPPEDRPSRILMTRLDRVGRGNAIESSMALLELVRTGVTIESRQDGPLTFESTKDVLLPFLRLYVAGLENDNRVDKLKAMYEKKRQAKNSDARIAVGTTPPYGLKIQGGRYEEQQPEAAAVIEAFRLAATYGAHRIAKILKKSAPPWILKNNRSKKMAWGPDSVRKMLRNPKSRDPCGRGHVASCADPKARS